jgi:hypothetical protein
MAPSPLSLKSKMPKLTRAPRSELIFNKYRNRYFVTRIFDEGNPDGSKVPESQYEKRVSKAAEEAQQRVPAHHRRQKGA